MTDINRLQEAEPGSRKNSPGRPRSPAIAKAILQAALDLLPDVGYGGLTMEGVAARAGVGKTTVYRRWPSKPALVVAAAEELAAEVRLPDTENVRDDLVTLLKEIIRVYSSTVAGRILPGLLADAAEDPELAEAIGGFWAGRRELMFGILRRGISRGELQPDIDLELVADLMYGPIYYRLMVSRRPLTSRFADQIVDTVLKALADQQRPA